MGRGVHRIQSTGGSGKPNRRRPVGCPNAQVRGVQKARAGIAREPNRGPKLQCMSLLGPGEIIQKVMHTRLEIVAVGDALIKPQKSVPRLVSITHSPKALPGESPMEGIGESGAKDGGVAEGEPLAVVDGGLLGGVSWQEGSSG